MGLQTNTTVSVLATATNACPNACSGHGSCGTSSSGVCACVVGWSSPDCSLPMIVLANNTVSNNTAVAAGAWSFFQLSIGSASVFTATFSVVDGPLFSFGNCGENGVVCAIDSPTPVPTTMSGGSPAPTPLTTASPTPAPTPAPVVAIAFVRAGGLPSQLLYDASAPLSTTTTIEVDNPSSGAVYYVGVLAKVATTVTVTAAYQQMCPNDCSGHGTCTVVSAGTLTCACDSNWSVNPWDCSIFQATLKTNTTYDGTVAPGEWRYYSLFVPLDKNHVTFSCNLTSPSNGSIFSLYISANDRPSLYHYSQRAPPNSTHAQITLSGTAVAGQWFVGVYGVTRSYAPTPAPTLNPSPPLAPAPRALAVGDDAETQFQLRMSMASLCPQRCMDHGACVQNHCNCLAGYVGDDCSSERLMLSAGVPFRGAVAFNTWNYYTITVEENALEIQVNETYNNFLVGLVWVYARRMQPSCAGAAQGHCLPTLSSYDVFNTSSTAVHSIYIPSNLANGTWNIGVTGSAAESARVDAEYVISAYVGCERYSSCESCAQDPNCGWCARDAHHGSCVAGDPLGTDKSGSCVAWFFAHCDNAKSQKDSTLTGTMIGISVGACVVFAVSISFVYFWWKQQQRKNRSPLSAWQQANNDSPQRQASSPAQLISSAQPSSIANDRAPFVPRSAAQSSSQSQSLTAQQRSQSQPAASSQQSATSTSRHGSLAQVERPPSSADYRDDADANLSDGGSGILSRVGRPEYLRERFQQDEVIDSPFGRKPAFEQ
jgi:hypothetical protein